MNFLEYFYGLNKKLIEWPKARVANCCDEFNLNLIASDFIHDKKTIFVITPSLFLAQKYYDTLTNLVSWDDVLFFPEDELVSTDMLSSSGDFLFERINTIYTLLSDSKKIVVLNLVGAIKYEMPKEVWLNSFIKLEENKDYDIKKLQKDLVSIGYEMVYTITKTGEFSKRGSIIDIFPLGSLEPIRLDFFGDTLETIKNFDVVSQRSTNRFFR
ncbi:MAG: hypothetical protein K6B64_02050 [Acholeplasmatales bacterium]|nr:hypothetical protein [Acholeplasmatales bacterium]